MTSALSRTLRRIAAGKLSRSEAAKELSCSERQVNRLMRKHGVFRPASAAVAEREAGRERRAKRDAKRQRGIEMLRAGKSVDAVAQRLGASVRTVYRLKSCLKNDQKQQEKLKLRSKRAKPS